MKKRLICLSLIFAMTATQIVPVAAARKDEVQAQKSATQSKLSDAQARVDELQSQKSALMNQISSTQQELVSVMTQVNMLKAKTDLSKLVKMLETGQEEVIYLARNGKAVVQMTLIPKTPASKRI